MIVRLLRRDPLVRCAIPVSLLVAALVALIGPLALNTMHSLDELALLDRRGAMESWDVAGVGTAMLAVEALLIAVALSAGWSRFVDGQRALSRCLPMELTLPIAPRSAWLARLIAHGAAVILPMMVVLLVLHVEGFEAGALAVGKVTVAALVVVLAVFGLSPERSALRGWREALCIIAALFGTVALLLYDLGVLGDEEPGGRRFVLALALAVSAVWALRAYRRLPLVWSAPLERPSKAAGNPGRATVAVPDPAAAWRRQGAVFFATLWSPRLLVLCFVGAWTVPFLGIISHSWVVVSCAAWLLFAAAQTIPTCARFLAALPVSRRRLLAVTLLPMVFSLSVGGLVARGWVLSWAGQAPLVTLDQQAQRSGTGFDVWVDVVVPLHCWRLAHDGVVPVQTAPDGEQVRPRAVHPLGVPWLTVYNPYDAPKGSSQQFTAWQFARALSEVQGVQLDASELSERYLETAPDGHVAINSQQVMRSVALHEDEGAPWSGVMGTLVHDHPELKARRDARRDALPVLALALLTLLACLVLLPLRPGSKRFKVLAVCLPSLPLLALGADGVFSTSLGAAHPQLLFALLGEAVLSWLPPGVAGVWAVTVGICSGAFLLMSRALQRCEFLLYNDRAAG